MTDLHELLFLQANDPGFIVDLETRTLLEINEWFAQLTGWSREDIAGGNITTRELIHPDDLDVFDLKTAHRATVERERYTLRIFTRAEETRHVEVSVATLDSAGRALVVGSLRDVTQQKRLESTLQSEIKRQRDMTYKSAQASVRIGQVLEKLRSVPTLARALLSSKSRRSLLDSVVRELTAGDKFSYARVAIYMRDELCGEGRLRVVVDSEQGTESVLDDEAPTISLADTPQVARAIAEGELINDDRTYVIPMWQRSDVIGALRIQFHEFEKNLFDEHATIRRAQEDTVKTIGNLVGLGLENLELYEKLQRQALVDEVTGVHNRRYFEGRVDEIREGKLGSGRPVSMVMLDIDRFKEINDSHGHPEGDRVLQQVAQLLVDHFSFAFAICRVGGDEFAVLAPGDSESLAEAAEEYRAAIETHRWHQDEGGPQRVTVSIGVATFDTGAGERGWLIDVDQALYAAKQHGRNRIEVWEGPAADQGNGL